jgi:hypothetical protein
MRNKFIASRQTLFLTPAAIAATGANAPQPTFGSVAVRAALLQRLDALPDLIETGRK